jgi:hypothetical protein
MAKQIISLGASANSLQVTYSVVFWFPITSGARPQQNGSLWSGASPAETTAIQNGTVLEVSASFGFPINTPIANIKAFLQQEWTNRNTQQAGVGPNSTFGVFFDSVNGWSA